MPVTAPQKRALLGKAADIALAAAGSGGQGNMSDELLAKIIQTTYDKMLAIQETIEK